MRKRVLLVEPSDTVRGVAETVLRQNGYEVIPVSTAEKALEVLSFSRPELIIVGAAVKTQNDRPFFERLKSDQATSSVPMLLIAHPTQTDLPFPSEVIMTIPFDPKDFLERVRVFTGAKEEAPPEPVEADNPLDGLAVSDDQIDAALGLGANDTDNGLVVTDSEVMDKTMVGKRSDVPASKTPSDSFHVDQTDPGSKSDGLVESVMIQEDQTDIVQKPKQQEPAQPMSSSQKLDILSDSDQYGMSNSDALSAEPIDEAHDYNWFVNEMQKEANAPLPSQVPSPSTQSPAAPTPAKTAQDSGSLKLESNSTHVEPVTASGVKPSSSKPAPAESEGVAKFIDEFRREIERIEDGQPESVMVPSDKPTANGASPQAESDKWEESVEKVSSEEVGLFTRELAAQLANRIAKLIIDKIDSDKLVRLIAKEAVRRLDKNQQ